MKLNVSKFLGHTFPFARAAHTYEEADSVATADTIEKLNRARMIWRLLHHIHEHGPFHEIRVKNCIADARPDALEIVTQPGGLETTGSIEEPLPKNTQVLTWVIGPLQERVLNLEAARPDFGWFEIYAQQINGIGELEEQVYLAQYENDLQQTVASVKDMARTVFCSMYCARLIAVQPVDPFDIKDRFAGCFDYAGVLATEESSLPGATLPNIHITLRPPVQTLG